jgi:hypothetical protein
VTFAVVRLVEYELPGENQISVRFLGYASGCSHTTLAPTQESNHREPETRDRILQAPWSPIIRASLFIDKMHTFFGNRVASTVRALQEVLRRTQDVHPDKDQKRGR